MLGPLRRGLLCLACLTILNAKLAVGHPLLTALACRNKSLRIESDWSSPVSREANARSCPKDFAEIATIREPPFVVLYISMLNKKAGLFCIAMGVKYASTPCLLLSNTPPLETGPKYAVALPPKGRSFSQNLFNRTSLVGISFRKAKLSYLDRQTTQACRL